VKKLAGTEGQKQSVLVFLLKQSHKALSSNINTESHRDEGFENRLGHTVPECMGSVASSISTME